MLLRSAAAPWGPLSLGPRVISRRRSLGTAVARACASSARDAPWGPPLPGAPRRSVISTRHSRAPPLLRGEAGAGSGSGSPQLHEGSSPQLRPRPPTLRASAGNPKSPPAAGSWLRGPPPVLRHPTVSRGHIGPGEAGGGSYFCFRHLFVF